MKDNMSGYVSFGGRLPPEDVVGQLPRGQDRDAESCAVAARVARTPLPLQALRLRVGWVALVLHRNFAKSRAAALCDFTLRRRDPGPGAGGSSCCSCSAKCERVSPRPWWSQHVSCESPWKVLKKSKAGQRADGSC